MSPSDQMLRASHTLGGDGVAADLPSLEPRESRSARRTRPFRRSLEPKEARKLIDRIAACACEKLGGEPDELWGPHSKAIRVRRIVVLLALRRGVTGALIDRLFERPLTSTSYDAAIGRAKLASDPLFRVDVERIERALEAPVAPATPQRPNALARPLERAAVRFPIPPRQAEQARALRRIGWSVAGIARHLGLRPTDVAALLNEMWTVGVRDDV